MKKLNYILSMAIAMGIFSCSNDAEIINGLENVEGVSMDAKFLNLGSSVHKLNVSNAIIKSRKNIPENLLVAIYSAEYITTGENGKIGNTVYFNNRGNKQLIEDFVPGLALDGTNDISYYVDNQRASSNLDVSLSNTAIDRAMNTWDNITCSNLGIFEIPFNEEASAGFVAKIISDDTGFDFGGSFDYFADVVHAGWVSGDFFDYLVEDGSDFILGVTISILFTDEEGNFIDLDNNGKLDIAFREIYYNDEFEWNDGKTFDVETVALHETGHGLSQAHFGKAFRNNSNGKLHFAPRAVMNAAYSGVQTEINQSDEAGHCSNWAAWSKN
jgi:hypothetical protein